MAKAGDKCILPGKYQSDCGPQWTFYVHTVANKSRSCPHRHKPVDDAYVGHA